MGKKPKKDDGNKGGQDPDAQTLCGPGRFAPCERPSPRCHCSLTEVEPGRLLLFGGEVFNGRKFVCFQEVYELTLSQESTLTWRKLVLASGSKVPQARSAHQAVTWQKGLWILGGEWADAMQEKFLQFKDLWCLNLSGEEAMWEQVPAEKGFSQRSGHRSCVHDGAIVVFGGYRDDASGDATYLNDVHRFDLTQRKFRKSVDMSGPAPKARSAAQLWSDGQAVWLYGGSTPAPKQKGVKEHMDALSDLWRLEADKWSGSIAVAGGGPGARSGFASAPLSKVEMHLRLFFGGVTDRFGQKKSEFSAFHNDAWVLDTKALSWSCLDLAPGCLQGRIGAQLAAVTAPGRAEAFVLFGGMAEAGPREVTMDDLWCITQSETKTGDRCWSCLLPLSDKTKTWFPDNDSDSSEDASDDAVDQKTAKKKKGKHKKAITAKLSKDGVEESCKADEKSKDKKSGKAKARADKKDSSLKEEELIDEPNSSKKQSRRKNAEQGKDADEELASVGKGKNTKKGTSDKKNSKRQDEQEEASPQVSPKASPKFAPESRASGSKSGFSALAGDASDESNGDSGN
eukprot:TRINITY_DN22575_c0_g1_i1.p1 TRINITY_DN22575_c0_g1~~TRINITY_DN22575_c0_g1_i1.p1  ORF type:complete len:569 (-),score=125.85 TRINITY_DN22575_c0_g1_i1:10-1716(-)